MSMSVSPIAIIVPGRAGTVPRRRSLWPLMVFALLGLNATIVGFTIYFAASDKSAAIEPDYYAKALHHDDAIRLREASRALGWTTSTSLRAGASSSMIDLVLTVHDRDGQPVQGATASAVLFSNVRSSSRQNVALRPDGSGAGVYSAPVHIDRSGLWCLRLTVERGPDTFAQQTDLLVPESR